MNKLNRLFSLLILAVSLSLTGVSSASATDYYVSTSGSDSNNGSASSPWATIAHADSVVGPGAIVHVAPGTYSGQFNTSASGTSSAYITYVSDTKWGAKIAGGSSSTWSNYGAYVTIQGFDVTGPTGCCNAIYTSGNATKIIGNNVHNVQTSNGCSSTGGGGIVVDSTNAYVIGNYAHDTGPYPTACNYIHGIYIANSSNPGSNAHVYNNIAFRNSGWGIQLWHSATNEIIVNNTIFDNATGGIVVGAGSGSGVTDDNTVVSNNIVFNNLGTDGGIVEEGSTGTHNVYTDNLVFGNTPVNISLQNGLTATGTVSANPLFVNFTQGTNGDYHLQSSSPAINKGTSTSAPTTDYDGNSRPQAGAWDIGAYEYAGSISTSGAATLSPTSLTFPNQTVGTTSAAKVSTLTNSGSATLTISSITLSGDFALAGLGTCGTSLASGSSCTISVTFKPTATGTRTGSVTISDSATGSPQKISLTGSGVSSSTPAASLSPTSLAFGNQTVGAASAARVVTLSNTGSAALSISGIAIAGTNSADFTQTHTCLSSLAAGTSCTISVTFKPAATGTRSASVSVTDNGSGSPQAVALSGSGVSSGTPTPVASLSPTSLAFGNQTVGTTSAAKVVTLSNTGTAALSISSIAVTGTNIGDFTQTHTCGASLAAGTSCTISVTFRPAATGTRGARVSVTDNASGSPQGVALSGSGVSSSTTGAAVRLLPTSLAFVNQTVGTTSAVKYVTLTNTGNATLTFSGSFAISGDFHFAGLGTCGSSVAAGASCTISVNFTPTATGTRAGAVTLNDNAPNTPQRVPLTGTGVSTSTTGAAVSLSPSSLSFGNQAVGTTSAVKFVTLTNTGHATLTFSGGFLISGNFAFAGLGTCGSSVAAGASCTISVKFTPTATGARTGVVTLNDNAPNTPQRISLSGSGT